MGTVSGNQTWEYISDCNVHIKNIITGVKMLSRTVCSKCGKHIGYFMD